MPTTERRRFSRVPFDCNLVLQQGEQEWPSHLLDISLKGVLLTQPDSADLPDKNAMITAQIELSEQAVIIMQLRFVREWQGHWALTCEAIDVDSVSHLRRLIELNLGDARACERELIELLDNTL